MAKQQTQKDDYVSPWAIFVMVLIVAIIVLGIFAGLVLGLPKYGIYRNEQKGKAELAKAEHSRKIRIEEARALKESAVFQAEAEVERARGIAEANEIIGNSLKGNDAYLRYLWIDQLGNDSSKVIYVPTEANLPILEAGRHLLE